MLFSVISAFGGIRLRRLFPYYIRALNLISLAVALTVFYAQTYFCPGVADASNEILGRMRNCYMRNSVEGRVIKSMWTAHFKLAHPLYLFEKATFLNFIEAVIDFLFTLILNSPVYTSWHV